MRKAALLTAVLLMGWGLSGCHTHVVVQTPESVALFQAYDDIADPRVATPPPAPKPMEEEEK